MKVKAGLPLLQRRDDRRPVVNSSGRGPARAPQVREKHRSGAASPCRSGHRRTARRSRREPRPRPRRRPGAKGVDLEDVPQAGKNGSRPPGDHAPRDLERRRRGRVPDPRRPRARSTRGARAAHGSSGATWFGTKSRTRRDPSTRQLLACRRQAARASEGGVRHVAAHAVGGAHRVGVVEVGERVPEIGDGFPGFCRAIRRAPRGCAPRPPSARPRRTPSAARGRPLRAGYGVEGHRVAERCVSEGVEPDPGVDLRR